MRKLGLYVAGNAVVWAGYHWIGLFPQSWVDRFIVSEIVAVCLVSAFITLAYSWKYIWFSVGILGFITGIGLLYYPAALDDTWFAIRQTPPLTNSTTPRWWVEMARTLIATGGAIMVWNLLDFAIEKRRSIFPWFRSSAFVDDPLEVLTKERRKTA